MSAYAGSAVVLLVGQPEAALADEHHVAVRVARVGLGLDVEEAAHALAGVPPDEAHELVDGAHGGDRGQRLARGCAPAASTASASMKLAYRSAIFWASLPGAPGSRVVMMSRTASSAASRSSTNAPDHRLVAGDLGPRRPGAVHVGVQVVLHADRVVEVGEVEGGNGLVGGLRHPVDATDGASDGPVPPTRTAARSGRPPVAVRAPSRPRSCRP